MKDRKRRVLLTLCGLSPQIITETLYALVVQRQPAWIPDDIHVITTGAGKRLLETRLLDPENGFFRTFCRDFIPERTSIRFSSATVHVVPTLTGDLEDVRTIEDNRGLADFIMEIVRVLTADEKNWLHASLAGGRKTMSVYLGMAMQFFGREQDELSHVLVNSPFENHPEFFYPPRKPKEMTAFDRMSGQPYRINSSDAQIELACLPFIRLRDQFSVRPKFLTSWDGLVEQVQKRLDTLPLPVSITFILSTCTVISGGKKAVLTPVEGALYYFLLLSKKNCQFYHGCDGCSACFRSPFEIPDDDILSFLENCWGKMSGRLENICKRLSERLDRREWFLQYRSRINRKFKRSGMSEQLHIVSAGSYGQSVYGVQVDKENIDIQ
ncbi:MAG: CRISPR-associated ring nuclease Csm6 [Pseudomonadota bacterium]|nr:CRISPR-associated ring nuclease Csm6 [Pseudomonadota bacterium]